MAFPISSRNTLSLEFYNIKTFEGDHSPAVTGGSILTPNHRFPDPSMLGTREGQGHGSWLKPYCSPAEERPDHTACSLQANASTESKQACPHSVRPVVSNWWGDWENEWITWASGHCCSWAEWTRSSKLIRSEYKCEGRGKKSSEIQPKSKILGGLIFYVSSSH